MLFRADVRRPGPKPTIKNTSASSDHTDFICLNVHPKNKITSLLFVAPSSFCEPSTGLISQEFLLKLRREPS